MVKYTCQTCEKEFTHKGNYTKHLNAKIKCSESKKKKEYEDDEDIKENQCACCFKTFSNKYKKITHEKTSKCFSKAEAKGEKDEKYLKLEEKIKELEHMIKHGINPITTTTNIQNTTNNTIIQNNFSLNKYGEEDLTHITDQCMIQIFRRCFGSVPAFIKMKHFSQEKPENCNVYIADIKGKYALVYNGKQWNVTDKKQFLHEMYEENCDHLVCAFKEMKEQLDIKTLDQFNKFIHQKDDDEMINSLKENIKLMLYNEREMAVKTRLLT
jgi:hypothetical protein